MSRPKHRRPKSNKSLSVRRRTSLIEMLEARQLLTSNGPFGYLQVPLAADQSGAALLQDAGLQGAWGVALSPGGGPVWVADNTSNAASRYTGNVAGSPFTANSAVTIPGSSPTGVVFNPTSGFTFGSGAQSEPATFLIASQNGQIDAWDPQMDNQATLGTTVSGAEFTGLAVATNSSGTNLLYAADFHNAKIDVFDDSFQPTTLSANAFTDSSLPAGYAPYNIELFNNNQLYVTYAKPDPANPSAPQAQAGNGAIVVYNLDGSMVGSTALISAGQQLNDPYGMAMAPETFGDFQGDLLVANGGDGHILAYNSTGAFQGYLNDGPGSSDPITIPGVRGLAFGTSGAGDATTLLYSASSGGHGQFGEIVNAFNESHKALVAVPTTVAPAQSQAFSGTLGTFADSDTSLIKDDFLALINWGDGSSQSAGTIVPNGSGQYLVEGVHTYPTAGTRQVTLTVSDTKNTVNETVTAVAAVTDPGFTPVGTTFSTSETHAFSGSVGSFVDPTGPGSADDYVANINWGDGTSTTTGNVTLTAANTYAVIGNHTYTQVGSIPVSVAIFEVNNGTATAQIGTISSEAMVADPNTLTATGTTLDATQGTSTSVTVATFTDTNTAAAADIFSATINWGDGTTASAGQVTGSNGDFTVTGSHAFLTNGQATVSVSINDTPGTATASATSTASVADGNTFAPRPMTFVAQAGQSFSGVVALFPDANGLVRASDFTATINWGDSNTTAGSLSAANGTLTVSGTHAYATAGASHSVGVTVTENAPGTVTSNVTSTAVVPKDDVTGSGGTISATATTASSQQVLATFTPNTGNTADAFTATIDWGDGGSLTAGTVTTSGNGTFTVMGSHTYSTPGTFAPDVIVSESTAGGSATPAAAITATANVASPVVLTAAPIRGTELAATTYTVATFTDASQPSLIAGDFTATIDWGDGTSTTTGNVTLSGGVFTVTGSHPFADEGTFNVKVTVSETSPSAFSTGVTSTATMAEGDSFTAGTVTLTATAGTAFSGPLAVFADSNTNSPAGDFTATIKWGDGSNDTSGSVTGSDGQFTINGNHTYAQDGSFLVTVTIQDDSGLPDAAEKVVSSNATVMPPAGFTATGTSLSGTEGTAVSGTVATFTDPGSTAAPTAFTATIDWGDGSSSTTAAISGSSGNYTVTGNHTYSDEGTFTVSVSILETANTASLFATSTADIADADSLTASGATFTATTGSSFTGAVATFTDVNKAALASDFTATINWGDSTSSTTSTSITGSNGTFTVTGTHVYSQAGSEKPTVTISDDSPGTASATATATASVTTATSTATATISGEVFNDVNVNGALDTGETGLAGITVFLNVDGSDKADGTNPQATTDTNGDFTLNTTATGTFAVMESITPSHGLTVTTPTQTLTLAAGQTISGVDLGDVLTSTVAPLSVQTPPSANSIANTAYIDALYQLILGRAPDSDGLTYWQGQLTPGASRSSVAADIWNSPEHRGLQVNQYYQEFLGRQESSSEQNAWVNNFEQDPNVNDGTAAVSFLTTSEYQGLHSGSTALVDALYSDVDLRAADSSGATYWEDQLNNATMTRPQVANDFVYGQEANTRLVDSFYADFLHRAPDSTALSKLLSALDSGAQMADQVAVDLLSSDEFYNDVTADQAPQFTSTDSTAFTAGTAGSFAVTTSGVPTGTITVPSSSLPAGVTFVDNGNGSGTLASTTSAVAGTYKFTLTVSNGVSAAVTQDFTLTIS